MAKNRGICAAHTRIPQNMEYPRALNLLSGPQLSQVTGQVDPRDFVLVYLVMFMLLKGIDFSDLMDYKIQHFIVSLFQSNNYNYIQI